MNNILFNICFAVLTISPLRAGEKDSIVVWPRPFAQLPAHVTSVQEMIETWQPYRHVNSIEKFIQCWSNGSKKEPLSLPNSALHFETRSKAERQVVLSLQLNLAPLLSSKRREFADFVELLEACMRRFDSRAKALNASAPKRETLEAEIALETYYHPWRADPKNGLARMSITIKGHSELGEVSGRWFLWPATDKKITDNLVEVKALRLRFMRLDMEDRDVVDNFSSVLEFDSGSFSGKEPDNANLIPK